MVVSMKEEVKNLDEMVVVGYTSQEDEVIAVKGVKLDTKQERSTDEEVIFQVVEEMPSFPGGMHELYT